MSEKIIDDVTGVIGSLAGLANDVRSSALRHAEKVKSSLTAADEIDFLKQKIDELESRIKNLEKGNK